MSASHAAAESARPIPAAARQPAPEISPERDSGRGVALSVRGLRKSFGDNHVLRGIDLRIAAGEFVAIVGRSECGKSTLLRLIAGLDEWDAGSIDFEQDAVKVAANVRVMFQEPRLLPQMPMRSNP